MSASERKNSDNTQNKLARFVGAILTTEIEKVQEFLSKPDYISLVGHPLEQGSYKGMTPLMIAAAFDDQTMTPVFALLLQNATNEAVMATVKTNEATFYKYYNAQNWNCATFAAARGHADRVKLLLKVVPTLLTQDVDGYTLLMFAANACPHNKGNAISGNKKAATAKCIIEAVKKEPKLDLATYLNQRPSKESPWSAMFFAIVSFNLETIHLLCQYHVNPFTKINGKSYLEFVQEKIFQVKENSPEGKAYKEMLAIFNQFKATHYKPKPAELKWLTLNSSHLSILHSLKNDKKSSPLSFGEATMDLLPDTALQSQSTPSLALVVNLTEEASARKRKEEAMIGDKKEEDAVIQPPRKKRKKSVSSGSNVKEFVGAEKTDAMMNGEINPEELDTIQQLLALSQKVGARR